MTTDLNLNSRHSPPRRAPPTAAFESQCTCLRLRRITRKITQRYDESLAPAGLRATQFGLLGALRTSGPVSVSKLAERMGMDRTTLTRNLHPLIEEGLVMLAEGPDARTRSILLTEQGRRKFASAVPLWRKAQTEVNLKLGNEGVARLHDALEWSMSRLFGD